MPFPGRGTPRPGLTLSPTSGVSGLHLRLLGHPHFLPPLARALPCKLIDSHFPSSWTSGLGSSSHLQLLGDRGSSCFLPQSKGAGGRAVPPYTARPAPPIAPQPPEATDRPAEGSTPPAYPAATLQDLEGRQPGPWAQTAWVTATQPPPAAAFDEDLT